MARKPLSSTTTRATHPDRERCFEIGHSSGTDGTGFGLNIVEQVVEAHGWEIRVTESDEGGARFEITGVELDTE